MAQVSVLRENFSSANGSTPPAGWSYKLVAGNMQYDSFYFTTKKYVFAPPVEGNFAFFDVYNGGQQGRSNGDGFAEDAYLITPAVNLDTSRQWTLAFDYHFMRLRSPTFEVLWRSDTASSWSLVWQDTKGTDIAVHQQIVVVPGSAAKGKGQFAFRWTTGNNALIQGYLAIDNVHIYTSAPYDMDVKPDLMNRAVICHDEQVQVNFHVKNKGTFNVNEVPVKVNISYPLGDTTFRDTLPTLKPGQQVKYDVAGKYTFVPGYEYTISLTSVLVPDTVTDNDTAEWTMMYQDTIQRPNVDNAQRCGNGQIDLFALTHLNDTTFWMNRDNVLLGKGKKFTTPWVTGPDTFYARTSKLYSNRINTYQGPYRFSIPSSGGAYLRLIANDHLVINALGQHFGESGTFEAEIYFKTGGYTGHERDSGAWRLVGSLKDEAAGWGIYSRIPIDLIELHKGDTGSFFVAIKGEAKPTFKRIPLTIDHPSASLRTDKITNKRFVSGGTLYSDLSWDGEVHFWSACMSEPDTISVFIISKPGGVKISANPLFNGLFRAGTLANPDQISEKGWGWYDVSGPTGKSKSDYGKTWRIGALEVVSTGGWTVPDTFYYTVPPMFGKDYELVFLPKGLMIDSTIRVRFTVYDLNNGCDTVITRFIHISRLPEPSFAFTEECVGGQVMFTNTTYEPTREPLTYQWNFGDGTSANGPDQLKIYQSSGTYTVKLKATNSSGISATVSRQIVIYKRPGPVIDVRFACENEPVQLEAKMIRPDEKITWLIDNQVVKDSITLKHIYNEPGTYQVRLIAANKGCTDTTTRNVFQFHRPVAGFDFEGRCAQDTAELISDVVYEGQGSIGYKWLLDGNLLSTTRDWKGIMPRKGNVPVTLIVASQFQCTDTFADVVQVLSSPVAQFDVGLACFEQATRFYNKTRDTAGLDVRYQWSFGDGDFSVDVNPTHNYQNAGEKQVALRATANNGCSDRKDSLVVVKLSPNARFTYKGACDGEGVVFTNYSEQSGGTLRYEWDFGDGFKSYLHSPVHAYRVEETTTFNVSLKVFSDNNECFDVHNEPVTIALKPVCEFKATRSELDRRLWQFEPLELDSVYNSYTWIFVGSGKSTNAMPVHRFEYFETDYKIILQVVNAEGCSCLDSTRQIRTSWALDAPQVRVKGVTVFPNPTSGMLNINFNRSVYDVPDQLILRDATGRTVITKELSAGIAAYSLDLSSLAEGVYMLSGDSDSYTLSVPVIITR